MEWLESPEQRELQALKQKMVRKEGSVLDLSMINPDIIPPRLLVDRLLEATLKLPNHRYAVSRGVRRAREGFSSLYSRDFGVSLDPEDEVCLTFGTKDAMNLLFATLRQSGKAVLLPSPTYQGFLYAAFHAGLPYEFYPVVEDEQQMLAALAPRVRSGRFSALVMNFPNNPTGITVSPDFYRKLGELLQGSGVLALNDFVYGKMRGREQTPVSMLAEPALRIYGVETYSLSKSYSVPGWRVGSIQGTQAIVEKISKMKSFVDYGLFLPLQIAAASALSHNEDVAIPITEEYRRRMMRLATLLKDFGWETGDDPVGASLWARLPKELRGVGSVKFVRRALECGVALTPGSIFGRECGEFVRFALVVHEDSYEELRKKLPQAKDFSV